MGTMLDAAQTLMADGVIDAPSEDAMRADVETLNMTPLFDGGQLELI